MPPKLLRKLLLAPLILLVLFEAICWLFMPFPIEPLRTLDLDNDLPGFKKNARIIFGEDQVRYLDWKSGEKPAGTVRIFYAGGLATQGMLQSADDTWWGRLHHLLKEKGYAVQSAARGFDRVNVLEMSAAIESQLERLKPDIIVLNAGFDDVMVPTAEYVYDKDKRDKLPKATPPSALKTFFLNYSQTARFKRYWSKRGENNQMQNQIGRKNVFKKFFEERMVEIQKLPLSEGILRMASTDDPVLEYLDGLAAMRDLAAKYGATLVLTGEATLHDEATLHGGVLSHTGESNLLAYISLKAPDAEGKAPAARPDPAWVMREMGRFASKAESFAGENKLTWFDLNGKVARDLENFFTDVILTDSGAAAAAGLLLPVMEQAVTGKK